MRLPPAPRSLAGTAAAPTFTLVLLAADPVPADWAVYLAALALAVAALLWRRSARTCARVVEVGGTAGLFTAAAVGAVNPRCLSPAEAGWREALLGGECLSAGTALHVGLVAMLVAAACATVLAAPRGAVPN